MKKYCKKPEIDALVVQLVRSGWHFHRGGRHGKLRNPQGSRALTVPISPSDHRASKNFEMALRRLATTGHGLVFARKHSLPTCPTLEPLP